MLKMLVIGGGRQIGKALSDDLDATRIEATFLNRGISSQLGAEFYKKKNIKYIRSARTEFIDSNDLNFDIVLDTCSYDPIEYSKESEKWKKFRGKYILISSAYVYEYDSCFINETSKLISEKKFSADLNSDSYIYGINKIKCERIASENLQNLLILRPGILLSEYDHTFRLEKWIGRVQSGFYPSDSQKKWITQILSASDFINFIVQCIDSNCNGIVNTVGTPISLGHFWNKIIKFEKLNKIQKKITYSKEFEFFEKKSESIISSDKAEKWGMIKTNSDKLVTQILKSKCKKY